MTPQLRLRSALPGRERWAVGVIRARSDLAGRLERQLLAQRGVIEVRANPLSARVLVRFDVGRLSRSVGQLLEDALGLLLADGVPERDRWTPKIHPFVPLVRASEPNRTALASAPMVSVLGTILNFLPYLSHSWSIAIAKNGASPFLARFLFLRTARAQLLFVAAATLAAMAANLLVENYRRRLWRQLAERVGQTLQLKLVEHYFGQEMGYLEDQTVGAMSQVVQGDTKVVKDFFDTHAHDAIQKATVTVLVGASLLWISPWLALITFLPFPLILLVSRYFQKKVVQRFKLAGASDQEFSHLVSNSLSGVATIKSFTAEQFELQRMRQTSDRLIDSRMSAFDIALTYGNLTRALTSVSFTLSIMTGGMLYRRAAISFGIYSLLLFVVPQLIWVIAGLDAVYDQYQKAVASARRILGSLDRESRMTPGVMQVAAQDVRGHIRFRNVGFRYGDGRPVFDRLDLEVEPQQTVALVGATGSGKSTLIKLLLRFRDVTDGSVEIDGRDIRELDLTSLRQAIGYVSQDVYLFNGTVLENIAYGRLGADEAEILHAARVAQAHEFIEALPDGYATRIGERGQKLSGGQRQRLSIARAVLKSPPILILDEATSALDNETEAAVQRSLEHALVSRTSVVIAHRLSTIQSADRIYAIGNGGVVESGTHAALLERQGLYWNLWNSQASSN